jgi:hypothetical protein
MNMFHLPLWYWILEQSATFLEHLDLVAATPDKLIHATQEWGQWRGRL